MCYFVYSLCVIIILYYAERQHKNMMCVCRILIKITYLLTKLCARRPIMRKIMRAHNRIINPGFWTVRSGSVLTRSVIRVAWKNEINQVLMRDCSNESLGLSSCVDLSSETNIQPTVTHVPEPRWSGVSVVQQCELICEGDSSCRPTC